MTVSMTGFAATRGQMPGFSWLWDLRSVNGKGLDLRLRVPDWIDGLEATLRADLQKALGRGNVSLTLKLMREGAAEGTALRLNTQAYGQLVRVLAEAETAARAVGVVLAPTSAADLLVMRGVLETAAAEEDQTALREALTADLPGLLAAFQTTREAEGAVLNAVISRQLDQIEQLVRDAASAAEARRPKAEAQLREGLARVLAGIGAASNSADPSRIAQELALLAVKGDVTEEIDRLGAHIAAARGLLADAAPVGRRFDFLMQEFLREANTLMSKAQDMDLTRIGLDLKTLIDQMREQVQNLE